MSVFKITGTIAAIGQSLFDNHATLYAFVEIVEPSGRRVMVRNVAVGNQVLSTINVGSQGEFFFDKFVLSIGRSASQLWGVKTRDGLVAFENRNFRTPFVVRHIGVGLFTSMFLIGIPYVILGLVQLVGLIASTGVRNRLFYGNDYAEAKRLRRQQAVQMIARVFAAALLASTVVGSANAAEFVYSATSGPTCTTIRAKREFNSWRCRGPAGYSAVFHDLGNMVAVEFGPSGKERALVEDSLMWQGAAKPFGDRVEWRLSNGRPYAAILRTWRQDFDSNSGVAITVEELLVIKVSPQGACRIGTIDGKRPDANAVARQMADSMAATFRCGADKPRTAAIHAVQLR